jgi:hypothetical protein
VWAATSDERVKKDVKPFRQGLAELEAVRPVMFKYNGLGGTEVDGKEYVGVIAQDLAKIVPWMVSQQKTRLHKDDVHETDIDRVDASAFTYMLINAVKEQQKMIQQQGAQIAALEHGRAPVMSSFMSGGIGAGVALGLLPLGLITALRRRRKQDN